MLGPVWQGTLYGALGTQIAGSPSRPQFPMFFARASDPWRKASAAPVASAVFPPQMLKRLLPLGLLTQAAAAADCGSSDCLPLSPLTNTAHRLPLADNLNYNAAAAAASEVLSLSMKHPRQPISRQHLHSSREALRQLVWSGRRRSSLQAAGLVAESLESRAGCHHTPS